MGFRFRLGPFTFGRSGVRLSLWGGGTGISIPLSGKGRTFGKVGLGPLSWYGQADGSRPSEVDDAISASLQSLTPVQIHAVKAFRADEQFLERIMRSGIPWRGIQERLKDELPPHLPALDRVAYALVPKAMDAVFEPQGSAWSSEKRPAKNGSGSTTWIVVK